MYFKRMRSAVSHSVSIIDSLLNLTRTGEPRLVRIDLKALADEMVSDGSIPPGINVIKDYPAGETIVNGDLEQFHILFRNILGNAVQAMEGRGTLRICLRTDDGAAELSFTDSGPGIATENLNRMFEPLFTTKVKGLGLGLAMTKIIVEKHKGEITVNSEPGQGATFTVRLPRLIKEADNTRSPE